ncbi:MAG: TlpA disulfide reductase family protein [Bryobacteraceae bacterium]
MRSQPSARGVAGIVVLAAFTIWITERAKVLEKGPNHNYQALAILHKRAPDFSLPALDGRVISLSDYHGKKKLVLSFWASWCGPCRLELPALRSFYQRAHKSDTDFELLAISIDDTREAAKAAVEETRLPFPVLLDLRQTAANAYSVYGIPTLFIIDKNGRVAYGGVGFDARLEFILASQLGIDPKTISPGAADVRAGH